MKALLLYYQQRAMGVRQGGAMLPIQPPPSKAPVRDIVQAHAEVTKRADTLRKLAGQEPDDGGRKA